MKNLQFADVSKASSTGEGTVYAYDDLKIWLILYVVGGRFDSDVDPFTDEDFDEDAEEIMESSQVSKLESSCIIRMHASV